MYRNYVFIVIFAILGNTATCKKWRSHHPHTHDWHHHHHDDWNMHGEVSSSSNEAHDWPNYSEYDPNRHSWDFGNQHQPYPNYDWGGNTDDLSWTIIQRTTPSPSTTFPADITVTYSETFTQPSDTTDFPSPSPINSNSPRSPSSSSIDSSSPVSLSPSTPSPLIDVKACQLSCPVTSEHQPVCGTDYQTYNNMGRFLCAQSCGVDVRIFLRRPCPALGAGVVRATKVQCINSCPITEENNPVCGSDDITYDNPSQLLCAQMCGYSVMFKSMSPCSEVTTTQATNLFRTPPIPYGVRTCIESCPTTDEFRPVCGTNDVTYENPSHLDCARICGIDVIIKERLPCGQTNNDANKPLIPSVDDQRVNPLPPTVQRCIYSCPKTAEFRPVCGTNGITYTNPSQLECDQLCGIRVNILQQSVCPPNTNNNQVTSTSSTLTSTTLSPETEACTRSCPQTPEYNPVCGTNGVTYNNPSHLSCAQRCGVRVDIKRRSACPRPTVPLTTTTELYTIDINGGSNTVNGENNAGLNVSNPPTKLPNANNENKPLPDATTISNALLLSIFSDVTTIKTTSTTESDEDVDFDTRFGEDGV